MVIICIKFDNELFMKELKSINATNVLVNRDEVCSVVPDVG